MRMIDRAAVAAWERALPPEPPAVGDGERRSPVAFRPFRARDLRFLALRPELRRAAPMLADPEYGAALEGPRSFSAFVRGAEGDGWRLAGCGGLVEWWPGRAEAWALVGDVPRRAWPAVTRFVAATLDAAAADGAVRVEAYADTPFAAAHGWLRALGFVHEARCEGRGPGGRDQDQYVRIRRRA